MQHWEKLGHLFVPDGSVPWMRTHAAVPFAERLDRTRYKIYFSARNGENRAQIGWIIVDIDNPSKILAMSHDPVLPLPGTGFFDEDGVMGCQVIEVGGRKHLYYIGWNRGVSVPMRNAIGLAVSEDGGETFRRYAPGPIMDRDIHDACFVSAMCVAPHDGAYGMWYQSCFEWRDTSNGPQHRYNIKYAHSRDGITWHREGVAAIDFRYPNEYAITVPRVLSYEGGFVMWYAFRGGPAAETYRIGFARSVDGRQWRRLDEEVDLPASGSGWDSEMICYPFLFEHEGILYMLYNGNGYGRTGFGLAALTTDL
jgi:predicted GH43/DUF377 family glycosyl hydrolase